MRWTLRRARASITGPAEVVDTFCRAGRQGRQAGDAGRYSIYQPVREGAPRCVRVDHLDRQLLGPRWWRTPLQEGEPVRAVAGELARERSPGKIRARDREPSEVLLFGIIHCRTSAYRQRPHGNPSGQPGRASYSLTIWSPSASRAASSLSTQITA